MHTDRLRLIMLPLESRSYPMVGAMIQKSTGDMFMRKREIDRRQFLKLAAMISAGGIGFPHIVRSAVLGKDGGVAPSNRITVGCIGMGGRGTSNMRAFMGRKETKVVAVCDVHADKRSSARQLVNEKYGNKDCDAYNDFRELVAREDIDVVSVNTPPHWHAIPSIEAARSGKDVFCEKPLSLTIAEAQKMVNVVRRYQRVFQTGSQQRSSWNFRFACELVRNGYIGDLKTVTVNSGGAPRWCNLPPEPVPDYIDWDLWLGQAPWRPFNKRLLDHQAWGYREYAGGGMTGCGSHDIDIAQWGMGMDDSGPVEIVPPDGKDYKLLTFRYANGVIMNNNPFRTNRAWIVLFTGTKGKVEVGRGHLRTWPDTLKDVKIGNDEIHLYESNDHKDNFLDCVRTRRRTICDVEIGCHSVIVCHLGNIAYWLNRPLKWDPAREVFVADEEANRLLSRPMRSPWRL
jgi:predicted dehydrogenase